MSPFIKKLESLNERAKIEAWAQGLSVDDAVELIYTIALDPDPYKDKIEPLLAGLPVLAFLAMISLGDKELLTFFKPYMGLELFQDLKAKRWEKIDERVQEENALGSPSEDWIVPPDEDLTLAELKKDPDYLRLRKDLTHGTHHLKKIAKFIHFNEHHDFDWVNFITPLVGHDALEDAEEMAKRLKSAIEKSSYFMRNLQFLFRLTDT